MRSSLDSTRVIEIATAFWQSKVLLTAAELDIFTLLSGRKMTAEELRDELKLHPRQAHDFFDALVALKLLEREGDGPAARYLNSAESQLFLDRGSARYLGGLLNVLNSFGYGFWGQLGEALKNGGVKRMAGDNERSLLEAVYSDPGKLQIFLEGISGHQMENFISFSEKFDFGPYRKVCDIGGGLAALTRILAKKFDHLELATFDLPPVQALAAKQIAAANMSHRIEVIPGDFFLDKLPNAEVIVMSNILHDWNLPEKKRLIHKIYDALPEGGVLVVIENLIDDARRENAFGLLMSLNMLVTLGQGFDFTFADFKEWCTEAGFESFENLKLKGPASAAIAYK